jgi:hypothetical protein
MNRIFVVLACLLSVILAATFLVGLGGGSGLGGADVSRRVVRLHFIMGVTSALGVAFVNSLVATWFIGTGRWCREVVETYRMDGGLAAEAAQLKRRTFPWSLASMLLIVGVGALGAAADPAAALRLNPPLGLTWPTAHWISASLVLVFLAMAMFVQWTMIHRQMDVIRRVMAEVKRIRLEKGLPVEE